MYRKFGAFLIGVLLFVSTGRCGPGPNEPVKVLPDAPKPKTIDKRFLVVYGTLAMAKTADIYGTSRAVSNGCWEVDPIFGGHHPSDRRLALTSAAYFAGEVALGYGLKRLGKGHKWSRYLWLIEPTKQTVEHVQLSFQSCKWR